jgi:predicted NodU family carbamoyl transferase
VNFARWGLQGEAEVGPELGGAVVVAPNQAFNENEPMVYSPNEALDCFLRTRVDVLVLGDWTVRRT